MTDNKEKYRKLMESQDTIPIFSRDWWMDAVCGEDQWDVLIVENNNKIVASMPYCMHKKFGLRIIVSPPLTPFNGINMCYPPGQKSYTRLSYEREIMEAIIRQLKALKFDFFCQNFHPVITNWLPFYWAGFQQTTRYTYRIGELIDLERLWADFVKSTRKNIRRAQDIVHVRDDLGIDEFLTLNRQIFARQHMELPYTDALVKKLDRACCAHDTRKIFFAEDAKQQIHAALYIVWDTNYVYALISGGDSELRNSGAGNLLMWKAIQFAAQSGRNFDFEGSMIEPIEHFNRSFAATQTPYFQISKMSRKWKLAYPARELYTTLKHRQG